jgi:predicted nucleic-acid-binding Zn-ribbon protein
MPGKLDKFLLYKCTKCSFTTEYIGVKSNHSKSCRDCRWDKTYAYYNLPDGLGQPLACKETFLSSIQKTQVAYNDIGRWKSIMFDETKVPREVMVDMMRKDPVRASFQFFDLFLHKDTGFTECKNWIIDDKFLYEIVMFDTEDPSMGNRIITHPSDPEYIYEKIAVKVLSLCAKYMSESQSNDVFGYMDRDGKTFLQRIQDMWLTKNLPSLYTASPTAYDIIHTQTYDPVLSGLKDYIKANLPLRDHVHHRVTVTDGEKIEAIPKKPGTVMVWVCRKCWYSCVYKAKIRSHLKTCPEPGEPTLLGVRVTYALKNTPSNDSRKKPVTTMSNFDQRAFTQGRASFDDEGPRALKITRMTTGEYTNVFAKESPEDLILSVFSHFYGKQADPRWQCCFKTDTSIYIYTTASVQGGAAVGKIYQSLRSERWPSDEARQLLLTQIRQYLFELIDYFGYDGVEDLENPNRQNGLSGLKTKIAQRNYKWLRERVPPSMEASWKNVDFGTLTFHRGHYPKLKEFTERLHAEIPHLGDLTFF